MQWFVFFNDQLLLKKEENNQYSVPCGAQAPLQQVSDLKIHDVTLTNGKKVKALAIKQPIDENDEWIMIGLRASYEYLPLADYQAAGKASQIL